LDKIPSPYYGKNSSNKEREKTLKHESQSIWKISRISKFSSSAVAKTIKRYDETGSHEDRHRKGRPRVTSAGEDKVIKSNVICHLLNTTGVDLTVKC
jgi:transposase